MTTPSPSSHPAAIPDDSSDYGSDIDEATATELFSQLEDSSPLSSQQLALESIEEAPPQDETLELRISASLSSLRHSLDRAKASSEDFARVLHARQLRPPAIEVEYDESNRRSFSPVTNDESNIKDNSNGNDPTIENQQHQPSAEPDLRSPLQRFRTRPKKPLSVTDLVSPAWCEQQYEYSLSKYGRVRQTPAMKQGSSVHKELEAQVHVHVPVQVTTAEDRFGLRLWNSIHALRTLRETGITRELEVWGIVEGEVVIGVVDEITTTSPIEAEVEARILGEVNGNPKNGVGNMKEEPLPSDQRTLNEFFRGSMGARTLESDPAVLSTTPREEEGETASRTYYVVDVKTRQSRTLPASGAPSRPTHMQLMLYHHLLSTLASGAVPGEQIFERYSLDSNATFSDQFIAELSNLEIGAAYGNGGDSSALNQEDMPADSTPTNTDPLTELLAHNNLSSLWNLFTHETALTFPNSQSSPASVPSSSNEGPIISPVLTAEFRTASSFSNKSTRADAEDLPAGSLLGRRSFPFDRQRLEAYLAEEMRWWRGERATRGVEVEEAFKCRICEFAEGCTWRATKVEEGIKKARLRREGRKNSEI